MINLTEEAFLLSTVHEFVKCWKSRSRSRLFIESVNGEAFVNFSVFLGHPSKTHSKSAPMKRKPPRKEHKRRKKSLKKIQRDNDRAAKFQEKKRMEAALIAASGDPSPVTSSPVASPVRAASVNFSFAVPSAEDVTTDAMAGITDPQHSAEASQEDQDNYTDPIPENLRDNSVDQRCEDDPDNELQVSASEEIESPELCQDDNVVLFDKSLEEPWEPWEPWERPYTVGSLHASAHSEEILRSKWLKENWNKICIGDERQGGSELEKRHLGEFLSSLSFERPQRFNDEELNIVYEQQKTSNKELDKIFLQVKQWIAGYRLKRAIEYCEKPILNGKSSEPCNSPNLIACSCHL